MSCENNWAITLCKILIRERYNARWALTQKFKEQFFEELLEGKVSTLKCKGLEIEVLDIDRGDLTVQLRIKIVDQNRDNVNYVDGTAKLSKGESLTLLDLNHALEITIS